MTKLSLSSRGQNQKIRVTLGLLCTLGIIHVINIPFLVLIFLFLFWFMLFYPWNGVEFLIFIIAALFFSFQNYVCLRAGVFDFKFKDILLMPYYEPFLWGFYFFSIKRFISENRGKIHLEKKSVIGLIVTSTAFSLFSHNSAMLFVATVLSTVFLLLLFHTKFDIYYALCTLVLGFIVELFGVSTGLWSYPAPDFLGIPYWFATMWISAGLLGRRFLIPLSEWLAEKLGAYLV